MKVKINFYKDIILTDSHDDGLPLEASYIVHAVIITDSIFKYSKNYSQTFLVEQIRAR